MTMFVSGKTLGAAAAAGALVAGAFFAISPTQAEDSCRGVKYPSKVSSETTLTVRPVAKGGQATEARVKVSAAASNTPTGTVSLSIDDAFFADAALDSLGRTAFLLPSSLKAGKTHKIFVRYPGDCLVNGSDDTKFQTIAAAGTGPGTGPANVLGETRSPIRIDAGD